VLAFRVHEMPAIFALHVWVFPRTVALFLLGAFAWRTGVVRHAAAHHHLLFGAAIAAILLGAGMELAAAGHWHYPAERLGAVVLALGYASAILAAVSLPRGRRMLGWAAPLGRMAFTNYLAQSVICGWIFYGYGYGLGQFGRLGVAATLAIGVCIYVAQVMFSAWWLRRYRFGPVEWFWRTCMYGVAQPMRQRADKAQSKQNVSEA
jgi:uncharacterized protein